MVRRLVYDLIYRRGAPWEMGPRSELVDLVTSGRLSPDELPLAVDLGCGSGANTVYLAEQGFDVTGVDFSPVALRRARALAEEAGVEDRCVFVEGDLTAGAGGREVHGPFDLIVDYGTLDDLRGRDRDAMTTLIYDLSRPGTRFLLWCFHGDPGGLPLVSFTGPSRMAGGLAEGEVERRFGGGWDVERLPEPPPDSHTAAFLLTRR